MVDFYFKFERMLANSNILFEIKHVFYFVKTHQLFRKQEFIIVLKNQMHLFIAKSEFEV